MDFASLMSSAISKSKTSPSPAPSAASSAPASGPQKYVRRAELEAQRHEAYIAEQEAAARVRDEKAAQKRKRDDEESARALAREEKRRRLAEESQLQREQEEAEKEAQRRKRLGLPPASQPDETNLNGEPTLAGEADLSEEALREKLREMGEPVVLFAESRAARLRRYRQLTDPKPIFSKGPVPTTLCLLDELDDMRVPAKLPAQSSPERALLFRQLASYFTLVLTEWARALDARPDDVKQSTQGRQALGSLQQSQENLKPLFRKFENQDLDQDILRPVVEIVKAMQERRYVDGNDGYLRLSIGKAAWPIGVTQVGIHERSARERLNESEKKTHILSDEPTRKYLQSIKRCLTFAQTRWPPEDQLQLMG